MGRLTSKKKSVHRDRQKNDFFSPFSSKLRPPVPKSHRPWKTNKSQKALPYDCKITKFGSRFLCLSGCCDIQIGDITGGCWITVSSLVDDHLPSTTEKGWESGRMMAPTESPKAEWRDNLVKKIYKLGLEYWHFGLFLQGRDIMEGI